MHENRIVVTGLGVISSIGNDINSAWQNIKSGKTGIQKIRHFDTSRHEIKVAGIINNFLIDDFIKKKKIKKLDLFAQYGIAAGIQAIEDSKLFANKKVEKDKVGIIIGSGIGGITSIEKNCAILNKYGEKKISPLFIPGCIMNSISGYLSIIYNITGPNLAVTTACATSGHAIYLGVQLLKLNKANVIIAGGSEKASTPLVISGFSATKALSKNKNPEEACRPWDINRDGFIIGDGAACIVMETYKHAINRNANIYAEIVGTGVNSDAFHIISPQKNGNGILNCMQLALDDAKVNVSNLTYINAHATSTKIGDISESIAIKNLIGSKYNKQIYIGSTKSITGHLLGAAGCIEIIFTILSIKNQVIPGNINLKEIDPMCLGLNFIKKTTYKNIKYAMSNSFGFGGTNSVVVLKKF